MSLLWNWVSNSVGRRCKFNGKVPSLSVFIRNISTCTTLIFNKSPSSLIQSSLARSLTSLAHTPGLCLPTLFSVSPTLLSLPVSSAQSRFKSGFKTHSGCKKRFRVRKSGSLKRGRSGKSHNTGYKTRERVNRLGSTTGVKGKKIEQRVRKLLNVYNA